MDHRATSEKDWPSINVHGPVGGKGEHRHGPSRAAARFGGREGPRLGVGSEGPSGVSGTSLGDWESVGQVKKR